MDIGLPDATRMLQDFFGRSGTSSLVRPSLFGLPTKPKTTWFPFMESLRYIVNKHQTEILICVVHSWEWNITVYFLPIVRTNFYIVPFVESSAL